MNFSSIDVELEVLFNVADSGGRASEFAVSYSNETFFGWTVLVVFRQLKAEICSVKRLSESQLR